MDDIYKQHLQTDNGHVEYEIARAELRAMQEAAHKLRELRETSNHNPQSQEIKDFQQYLTLIALSLWGDKDRRALAADQLKQTDALE